jgi:hypothetical protein
MKDQTFGTGYIIISLKKLGSAVWALTINRAPLILLQAMEGYFPVALNEFFAHIAVALTALRTQDIQTQETLQIAKLTDDLLENGKFKFKGLHNQCTSTAGHSSNGMNKPVIPYISAEVECPLSIQK